MPIAAQKGRSVYQLDVKSTFLNGFYKEDIYVEQPTGFAKQDEEEKVYKVQKALYDLKQAPKAWFSHLDQHLLSLGFKRSFSEHTLYFERNWNPILIDFFYVNDILVIGYNEDEVEKFKNGMKAAFDMSDLGKMSYFVGMEVQQTTGGIFMHQSMHKSY